jgi:hypothetical protein
MKSSTSRRLPSYRWPKGTKSEEETMKRLKVGFDRWLRGVVSFNTATIWITGAVLAWAGHLFGSLAVACLLTALALYLRFCLSRESQL